MKYIVITGVSTGIGYSAAKVLSQNGYHVIGSVRKEADAEQVKADLGDGFTPVIFDVTKQDDVLKAAEQVKGIVGKHGLAGLINNAGIAVGGPLLHLPLDEIRWQMEVNVIGLIGVTQAFAPLLGAQRDCPFPPGKIINISSVAGKFTSPFLAAYSASKHAVEAISHGFRREFLMYGIDVIIVGPGPIKTPIIDKFPKHEEAPYFNTDYKQSTAIFQTNAMKRFEEGLEPDEVGELLLNIMVSKKPKTRYPILANKFSNWTLPSILPDRLIDKEIGKMLKLDQLPKD